ncbi:PP2C family protein-serine/threonine phosphatase [Actinoplanes sp. NPDC051859]|uniref:PP2C family protein-serine/threonine phosphatase n=1 Tax=Actinoplanes sp. NPDC051859 TaxID=3363909 RepID=UPI0037A3CFCF
MINLAVEARTHVGSVRQRNEDAHLVGRHLIVVADGLGGHPAGDVASRTAVDAVREFDRSVAPGALLHHLGRAVAAANEAIFAVAGRQPECAGMGTTLVGLGWAGSAAAVVNVGDLRAYLLRDGVLRLITEDHVYGNLLSDAASVPALPERQARFLDGRRDGRSPDLIPLALRSDDRLLLCSDGLSTPVPDRTIAELLGGRSTPAEVADRLVGAALGHGGPDNVTVVVAQVR